ncbi:4-diphosphocytidyl-2-C-methyl-D-erythritol kinase [Sphingomonas metalli]|uniref:4-diphosphocytidyl-2-C-methyl-D-erythritol kinase n=1 Tax=Sphingomonas metalli TaxID=1779358 RepID=A0A916T4X6_9SPHN|nr:4-(cytidine 5'-diphospho)-2-C-methyl-D-erythritol kinase [Sphingomonas metalli]GGB31816.1 4-diphosphocytidyl-2-C-methyl-D-erythritol kinase [Sphingomonas metalli]
MIVEPAPAKVNLALHVRARRADGYHALETLFAFARDGDLIEMAAAEADAFAITGPFAAGLEPTGDNLVTRARDAFRATFEVAGRHAITLTKNLPIASGIGGGSADAAATLRGLARMHGIDAADARLVAIATRLGADVPACLAGRTMLGTGTGTELVAIDGAAGTPMLLVNPGVAVPTAAVFAGWDGMDRGPLPEGTLLDRARAGRNDLEPPALQVAPVIAEVRAMLDAAPGVILSRMSGSGATCFALFASDAERDAAAAGAQARGWWILATALA